MPQKNQRSVTLHSDIYDRAEIMAKNKQLKVAPYVADLINRAWEVFNR